MKPIVQLKDIHKYYGALHVVKGVNFDLMPGEFVTLLGPSGCGKSTTLRMFGGFETTNEGQILLNGEDITRHPPNRRNVNMVFQDYALFPHRTVGDNVGFGLEFLGWDRPRRAERIDSLLKLVRLDGYRERYPNQLSGGQRQRVALARALARDPSVLLLDEPFGALDANLRHDMQAELKALQIRTGKTFLFVTHDQEEALTMSDRIIVMNEGRVEQIGAPKDLYRNPETLFVAKFIGEANLLNARRVGNDNGNAVLDCQGRKFMSMSSGKADAASSDVHVMIRPEDIQVGRAEPDSPNKVSGRVAGLFFKGDHVRMTLVDDAGNNIIISASPNQLPYDKGDQVWASWDPQDSRVVS